MSTPAAHDIRAAVQSFAAVPARTLPSLQSMDPSAVDKASVELTGRDDKYVSESDIESFLMWHGAKGEDIAGLFELMDGPNKEQVHKTQLMIALSVLGSGAVHDKIPVLFRAFDANQDGVLQRAEFEYAMTVMLKVAAGLANPLHNIGPYSKTRCQLMFCYTALTPLTLGLRSRRRLST